MTDLNLSPYPHRWVPSCHADAELVEFDVPPSPGKLWSPEDPASDQKTPPINLRRSPRGELKISERKHFPPREQLEGVLWDIVQFYPPAS